MYDFRVFRRIGYVEFISVPPRRWSESSPLSRASGHPLTPEALCSQHAARVLKFAAMVAQGDLEAEDLAQDALERAIRKLHQFDPRRGSVENWLWRIVVNAARDAGRVGRRRFALWERLAGQQAAEPQLPDVEESALGHVADADLLARVRQLPARDRALIGLRFGADLDHAAIGAALGMTPATASAAVRRALHRLRNQLEANP